MKCSILTLFPGIVEPYFSESLMQRGVERGLIEPEIVDFRDYATDKHRSCDDYAYGGGPGMVLKADPLARALESVTQNDAVVVFPSPSGHPFDQDVAEHLAGLDHLVFICGRYEGVDQRIIDRFVDFELSLGDYVMSSGELAAMAIVDTVARLIDGFINAESLEQESFGDDLLEYPHYTRPECHDGVSIPDILQSGHHERIETWRSMKRIEKTAAIRPDIFSRRCIQKKKIRTIQYLRDRNGRRGNT
jgi:tRNA (guanine37-N1)-methyltransferase